MLYDEYVANVYRFVWLQTANPKTAEILTEEIFRRVQLVLGQTEANLSAKLLLYRIARGLTRRINFLTSNGAPTLSLLSPLPEEKRTLFLLLFVEKLSIKGAAKVMRESSKWVRTNKAQLLSYLRSFATNVNDKRVNLPKPNKQI